MALQTETVRDRKLERLRASGIPRVLDLFAGCGGLSLGFHAAGCRLAGALEVDETAVRSHAMNFFRSETQHVRLRHAQPFDITETDPTTFATALAWEDDVESAIDVIVGGPPCQAFARVGRAKLREVASHPEAFLEDPRSDLFLRFLEYVEAYQPLAILMENVPDALNYGGHNIAQETAEVLADLGYIARYTLLNAVNYGVPQMRERMFLLAYAEELQTEVSFPSPSHWIDLPSGYHGSRQVALRSVQETLFSPQTYYTPARRPTSALRKAVTAWDAISDLPAISLHLEGKLGRGARRFDQLIPYEGAPTSEFSELMRTWPGFENKEGVYDHVIRYLPRDYRIFHRMNPGDQYPEALQHAKELFAEHLDKLMRDGRSTPAEGTKAYEELRRRFVPPYDASKFPNKWRKMEADAPARTLMAHLGKDSYSHIHYDSEQSRTISVREAARLQSFPDGFRFAGTMNPAFRQIGNAVPPILARALAQEIRSTLLESAS